MRGPGRVALLLSSLLLVAPALHLSHLARAQETETFYRLRFEFNTTSDFSTVYLDSKPVLWSALRTQTDGLDEVQVTMDSVFILQPIENAGAEVGVVYDSAAGPEAFRNPFDIRILKGHIGKSTLRIHNLTRSGLDLLGEFEHDGVTDDNPDNIRHFSLDVEAAELGEAYELTYPGPGKMLWAFYSASYTAGEWEGNASLKDSPVVPYSSDDATAIARHMDQAAEAGIEGFIVSWDGPGSIADGKLPGILQAAAARSFAIAIELEALDGDSQLRTKEQIGQWLTQLLQTHGKHPAYMQADSLPVVFVSDADQFPLDTWQEVFTTVRGQGLDGFFIGDRLENEGLDVFDSVYGSVAMNDSELNWQLIRNRPSLRYRHLLSDSQRLHLATATVQPGYDDTLLGREPASVVDRLDGETYRTMWDRAQVTSSLWMLIASWNHYYENTHIEPSVAHGDAYLGITKDMRAAWDQPRPTIAGGGIVNSASYRHNTVAPGEIITIFGEGIGPEQLCTMELTPEGTHISTEVCETQVFFNGTAAPIVYARSDQTSVVAPLFIERLSRVRINVSHGGVTGRPRTATVSRAVPGIFAIGSAGAGQAAALHTDYSVISPTNPTARGATVLVYFASGGATDPAGEDGQIVSGIEVLQLPVRAEIGGKAATVTFAGSAPNLIKGAYQANVRIPDDAPIGDAVTLYIWVGGMRTQEGITLAIE